MKNIFRVGFCFILFCLPSSFGSEIFFFHNDHLGSVRAITKNEINDNSIDYEPFGYPIQKNDIEIKYNTKLLDKTDLYYYGARFYDPKVGRFITPDSVEKFPQPYAYVLNNPLKFNDPDGNTVKFSKVSNEKLSRSLNQINQLVGKDIFMMNQNNEIFLQGKFQGNEYQKQIYDMMIFLINSEMTIEIKPNNKKLNIFISTGKFLYNYNEIDLCNVGKEGSLIINTPAIRLAHELFGHAYTRLNPSKYPDYEINNEVYAIQIENIARKAIGLTDSQRVYYASRIKNNGIEVIKAEDWNKFSEEEFEKKWIFLPYKDK